ncbi:uracil-DNA glycosylase family protein [Synechococcus sp. PCC 7336]|uniref:uracil-DNA glycosylase n=1 Tax=Synechococcus sp. PCC 7336 TaxID=195250 RepID=UPI00034CC8C0|nr:uracil-DNA glycosylase [Synechococcus sp. PCC 7336]
MSEDLQPSLFNLESDPQPPTPEVDRDRIPYDASIPIPPGTYSSLELLATHCAQCQRCELHTGRTNIVVQRGNPSAAVMIVGEGPGQNEDEQGKPFVGKSGQLLDKILQSVAFDPAEDVYICNVVKCRPPGNRAPTPAEMEACKPYLMEQIRIIDPKIILLTGATAVRAILKEKRGITKIRGQWFEWEGRLAMPIFHPAYLLRNQSRKPGSPKWLMWQDIQAVKAKYEELGLGLEF